MTYIGDILLLATCVAATLVFSFATVAGLMHGRLKSEPSQPWVTSRERPLRFGVMVVLNLGAAVLFAIASLKLGQKLFP
jgi:hypothetical protein